MTATHGEGPYGNAVGVTTPIEHKMAQVTEFVKTTTKNVIRPGVLYNGDTSLVAGTAGMSYDVDAFSIVTQRSATSGVVKWANDGTLNVATTAAPGSNSRYDVVYAWHREYALDGVDSNPVIGVVQGTAAPSPEVPPLAAFPGAVELARILIPAGVVATNSGTTFTQTAPFTTTDGGRIPVRNTTELAALGSAYPQGTLAWDISTNIVYSYYAAYNASTNPGGANPAGWYPPDGAVLAQATRFNTSTTITTTATAIGSLSAIGVATGAPVAVDLQLVAANANSGGTRYITVQIFEDATALGTARQYNLPYVAGVSTLFSETLHALYTPAAGLHTWTVKVLADANGAVTVFEARLVVRAATPRS